MDTPEIFSLTLAPDNEGCQHDVQNVQSILGEWMMLFSPQTPVADLADSTWPILLVMEKDPVQAVAELYKELYDRQINFFLEREQPPYRKIKAS